VLRRSFDELLLTPILSPDEVDRARKPYPALAEDPDLGRLPKLFAAVNLLTDRYQHHRADEPSGVAVAKAAIDWQRAGMPPGSIDEPTLRAPPGRLRILAFARHPRPLVSDQQLPGNRRRPRHHRTPRHQRRHRRETLATATPRQHLTPIHDTPVNGHRPTVL
jgi:hypothetical protein